MKKTLGLTAFVAVCVTLFSFSTADAKKAKYNEVNNVQTKLMKEAGSFQKYENGKYTSDKGTWSTQRQIWSLTAEENSTLSAVEKSLN
jgi:hypothetical protein